jgi:copper(I)-binding protein
MKHGGKTVSQTAVNAPENTDFHLPKRIIMQFGRLLLFIITLTISALVFANDYKIGNLYINHAVARPSYPGQPSGAAYFSIENRGSTLDKLISISSPIAKSVQIHTMSMEGGVMKMREADGIEIKPSSKIIMQPGNGYHIMLIGLKQPLKPGDKFPLTLTFEKAGKLRVPVVVEGIKSGMDMTHKDSASHPNK